MVFNISWYKTFQFNEMKGYFRQEKFCLFFLKECRSAKTQFLHSLAIIIECSYHLPKPGWFVKDDVYQNNADDRKRDKYIYDSEKDQTDK